MPQHNTVGSPQRWYDRAHASLCLFGTYLREIGFFEPVERRVHLRQKVLKYPAVQKLERLFVGLLAGIKAVSHTATTVRVDAALTTAFGLPGGADQSVSADTLDATTEADVADLAAATGEIVWETGISARRVESLPPLQAAIQGAERRHGLARRRPGDAAQASTHRDPPGQRLGQ